MEIVAKSRYTRISPRKLRLVADSIRGMNSKQALVLLSQAGKRGEWLSKTLKQAIANAQNNFSLKNEDLKIKKIEVSEGPIYKRFQPVSRGQAHPIKKRTSHIKVILEAEAEKKKMLETSKVSGANEKGGNQRRSVKKSA
ncbi:MAG: 50S ribosomal protein L22 [Patescibacteria group bacterium]